MKALARNGVETQPEKWAELQTALDAPPRDILALRKLLTEPSVVERSHKK
jgi:hypothetical protein